MAFTIWTTIAVAAGGLFELIPSMAIKGNIPTIEAVRPYSPLELEGRDVYISEGCVNCHSQMVRPFREETLRYGEYSKPGEYVYDHPFLWGSRRIGPDLQRVGGKYPDSWHYDHMMDPQSMSPGSLMPTYTHLFEQPLNFGGIDAKVQIFSGTFGAPYNKYDLEHVEVMARGQAATIAEGLMAEGRPDIRDKKIVALIAYLQRLGTDIRAQAPEATP
jgi:cytochrome c oxidase cbb3-type subunit I/II